MELLFNSEDGSVSEKPEPFASLLRRVSLAVQKERGEMKATLPAAVVGAAQQMPLQPAIIGADNSTFQFLMNPLDQNLPMFAPSQQNYPLQQSQQAGMSMVNPMEPIADANSVSAANFAGLVSFHLEYSVTVADYYADTLAGSSRSRMASMITLNSAIMIDIISISGTSRRRNLLHSHRINKIQARRNILTFSGSSWVSRRHTKAPNRRHYIRTAGPAIRFHFVHAKNYATYTSRKAVKHYIRLTLTVSIRPLQRASHAYIARLPFVCSLQSLHAVQDSQAFQTPPSISDRVARKSLCLSHLVIQVPICGCNHHLDHTSQLVLLD